MEAQELSAHGAVTGPSAPAPRLSLRERLSGGLQQGLMSAASALLAWAPTQLLGLKEGFWAAITAIAVTQSEFAATTTTAHDQSAGAAIGGGVAVGVTFLIDERVPRFALAVVIAIACCWLLRFASASRLAGITAAIITLVPHEGSAWRMMVSRVGEVGWGVTMALAVVWLAGAVRRRLARRN